MTTYFVGDVHVGQHKRCGGESVAGINRRCHDVLDALRWAYQQAKSAEDRFVSLGDLFDTSCPSPQELNAVASIFNLNHYPYNEPPFVSLLLGNHEMVSNQKDDHALAPLQHMGMTDVVQDAVVAAGDVDLVLVPFQPGDARAWFPKEVERFGDRSDHPTVLCFHLGIADDDTPPYLRNAHDAVPLALVQELCAKYGYKGAVAGNWHSRKVWDAKDGSAWVIQIGTLAPTGWDNAGLENYGTVLKVDANGYEVLEAPGPRFIDAGNVSVERMRREAKQGKKLYLRQTVSRDSVNSTTERLQALKDEGVITDFFVQVDKAYTESEAKDAAEAAQSAETLDASLSGFVENMHLVDGVDRAEVLSLAARYLAAAGG